MSDVRSRTIPLPIEEEVKTSYLNYAMSVIVARALPDVRDGLKPVHRRILFGMNEMGLHSDRPYKKCARITGDVLGKYHPHGDMAIYDSLVRLAQDFNMRYPVVDGQGNFGSIDGDPPAAVRYTEARMNPVAEEMLRDIDKDTVDFGPNYDGSQTEPLVLPGAFPFLAANGASGIAVGMATNIPPQNLREICAAIVTLIDYPGYLPRGSDEDRARARLPHRRHHPGPQGHPGCLYHGQGQDHRQGQGDRGELQLRARTPSSSPRSPTR